MENTIYKIEIPYDNFNCVSRPEVNLINYIRMLWAQHSTWTGMAINSIVLKLPDEEFVVARLLKNPVDFKIALSHFYNMKDATSFEKLLSEHLQLAAEFIKATIVFDIAKSDDLEKRWVYLIVSPSLNI